MNSKPKVMASGCYDLLHGGHIEFFRTAAEYGDLYVCLGSDQTIEDLKNRPMMFNEGERCFMVQAVRYVHEARVSRGRGLLDFEPEIADIKPDFFVVNDDGMTDEKRALCEKYDVELVVLPRTPAKGLPARSSSEVKTGMKQGQSEDWEKILPYRICMAGGWMDQPWVSEIAPGAVITLNIQPDEEFRFRGGMATSSREKWKNIAPSGLFADDPMELAKLLFGYENPPGTKYVSGSQDHLGLTMPGVNYLHYEGHHWIDRIDSIIDDKTSRWLEQVIVMVKTCDRPADFNPLLETDLSPKKIQRMAEAAEYCWQAIQERNAQKLGEGLTESHIATAAAFPRTLTEELAEHIAKYDDLCIGRNISGAGAGGYLTMVTEQDVPNGIRVNVRR
jgi:cytidyltransferase-like protein